MHVFARDVVGFLRGGFSILLPMIEHTISIPETVDIDKRHLSMIVAGKLYEQGRLSLGQAAEVVGITKRAFIELLSDYGVSIFNFPVSDLSKEAINA
jgi:predicted HTH domain antitoxin